MKGLQMTSVQGKKSEHGKQSDFKWKRWKRKSKSVPSIKKFTAVARTHTPKKNVARLYEAAGRSMVFVSEPFRSVNRSFEEDINNEDTEAQMIHAGFSESHEQSNNTSGYTSFSDNLQSNEINNNDSLLHSLQQRLPCFPPNQGHQSSSAPCHQQCSFEAASAQSGHTTSISQRLSKNLSKMLSQFETSDRQTRNLATRSFSMDQTFPDNLNQSDNSNDQENSHCLSYALDTNNSSGFASGSIISNIGQTDGSNNNAAAKNSILQEDPEKYLTTMTENYLAAMPGNHLAIVPESESHIPHEERVTALSEMDHSMLQQIVMEDPFVQNRTHCTSSPERHMLPTKLKAPRRSWSLGDLDLTNDHPTSVFHEARTEQTSTSLNQELVHIETAQEYSPTSSTSSSSSELCTEEMYPDLSVPSYSDMSLSSSTDLRTLILELKEVCSSNEDLTQDLLDHSSEPDLDNTDLCSSYNNFPHTGITHSSPYNNFPHTGITHSSPYNSFPHTGSSPYNSFPHTGITHRSPYNSFPHTGITHSSPYNSFPHTGITHSSPYNSFPHTGITHSSPYNSFPHTGITHSSPYNSFPHTENCPKNSLSAETLLRQSELLQQQTDTPSQQTKTPSLQTETPEQIVTSQQQQSEAALQKTKTPTQQTNTQIQLIERPIQQTEVPPQLTETLAPQTKTPPQQTESPPQQTETLDQQAEPPSQKTDTSVCLLHSKFEQCESEHVCGTEHDHQPNRPQVNDFEETVQKVLVGMEPTNNTTTTNGSETVTQQQEENVLLVSSQQTTVQEVAEIELLPEENIQEASASSSHESVSSTASLQTAAEPDADGEIVVDAQHDVQEIDNELDNLGWMNIHNVQEEQNSGAYAAGTNIQMESDDRLNDISLGDEMQDMAPPMPNPIHMNRPQHILNDIDDPWDIQIHINPPWPLPTDIDITGIGVQNFPIDIDLPWPVATDIDMHRTGDYNFDQE